MSRFIVSITVCCILMPLMVSANVGRDYGESVRALSKKDWQKAELKIRDALAEVDRAQPDMEVSGGVRFPYMPWYVLGSALQGQGDCSGAVSAWRRSLENGVVQTSEREHDLLQSGLRQCELQLAQAEVTPPPVSESTTIGSDTESLNIPASQADISAQDEPLIAQHTPPDKHQAGESADDSSEREKDRLEQDRIEEERRRMLLVQRQEAERRKQESERLDRLAQVRQELRVELDRAAVAIEESYGDKLVVDARVRLVELSNASSSVSETESAQDISLQLERLQSGLREYRQVAQEWQAEQQAIAYRTPPPDLRLVAEFYFAGDYESVLQEAEPISFVDPRHKIQAYLFRSAARFNLFWLEGENDPSLIESANSDIAEIKRLDADFQPYVAAFSPRFLSFFRDI